MTDMSEIKHMVGYVITKLLLINEIILWKTIDVVALYIWYNTICSVPKKHAVLIVTKQRHFFLILFLLSFKTTNIYISHALFMMNSGCMIQHSAFFNMSSRPGFNNTV